MIMVGFDRQLPIDHLARALKSHQDQLKKSYSDRSKRKTTSR